MPRIVKGSRIDILAFLSLALCLALIVVWVGTIRGAWTVTWADGPDVLRGVRAHRGAVSFARVTFRSAPQPWDPKWRLSDVLSWRTRAGGHGDVPAAFGFDFYDEHPATNNVMFSAGTLSFRVAFVPLWAPVVLTGLLPLLRLRRALYRRGARRRGLCAQCGYDLRATPERCPECGAVPVAAR
jgi:hypothetical protein